MTSDQTHHAINEGLARLCCCYTFEVTRTDFPDSLLDLPASIIQETDCFMWQWTGHDDNVAPSDLVLPFDEFYRSKPDVNWVRYVIFFRGHIIFFKGHGARQEFVGELANPDMLKDLTRWVREEIHKRRIYVKPRT